MYKILLSLFIITGCQTVFSQGMSFSYFIPRNGYLSAPVSPFSVRGIGFGKNFGMETGGSIYNVPGLAMEDLPFSYEKSLIGPHFALFIPLEAFAKVSLRPMTIKFMAGGFIWWNINARIQEGHMDRAFRAYEGWEVLNTNFDLKDQLGRGIIGGMELEFFVSKQFSLTSSVQYLLGSAQARLRGNYTGGSNASGLQTKTIDLSDPSILIEGTELSLGVVFHQ